jgi:Protein of unknown function (DUF3108)
VLAFCRPRRAALLLAAALAAVSSAAGAQGRLDASYSVTLAGIPIGKGDWTIDITDTHFTAAGTGTTTGLMRVFTGGHGASSGKGTLNNSGQFATSIFTSSITSGKKTESVRFNIDAGNVKDLKVDPPQDVDDERVPVTEESQQGVFDPMSASILRTPGTGEPVSPEACQRTVPIFDGKIRYDLQFAFKRMEQVKADKGYAGPVVVCAVYFTPIAGFVPSRAAIRYLTKIRDMEVWLAPIAGTRMLAPFRGQGPTPVGPVVFAADKFVSTAMPTRASVSGAKVQ